MTSKTLADLLREDGAKEGDVYEACGQEWQLDASGELITTHGKVMTMSNGYRHNIPADGWKRVNPRMPLRVEFENEVEYPYECGEHDTTIGAIAAPVLAPFYGKHVKVTVEEVKE